MIKSIIAIALLFSANSSFAQDNISKAYWINTPVKIDGNAREWKQPFNYYDPSSKLFFAFANDDKDLYICFQSPDEMNQVKIMQAGMKVTLSSKGKDKHKVSISFPIARKVETQPPASEKNTQQKINPSGMKYSFLIQNTTMEVKGFATKNGIIPINDSSGINAAINWDDANKFTYEIAIPLKELFGSDYSAEDILKGIVLDAEVNAVTRQSRPAGGNVGSNGFAGRGGGRRMGSGGRRGENNSGNESTGQISGDRLSMFEKGELKQKFILASQL